MRRQMKNLYQMALSVERCLEKLGFNQITITEASTDENLEKSYRLIQDNPTISKEEFLAKMEIEEENY